jgi:endonuclease/exonuclease/phosphatase (EEP) superfamily protein YafD
MAAAFRVMTYNVWLSAAGQRATLDAIADGDADLVLLQEATPAWERALQARFAREYPYMRFHHGARPAGDLGVLSRRPIVDDTLLPPAGGPFPAQRLVVDTASGAVQVLHVHLQPMLDGGDPVRGFFTTPPIRRREIEAFWQAVAPGLPTLAAGDFNEEHTVGSALAYLVDRGLRRVDAGALATWEFQGSWRGNDVHLRLHLDHLYVDAALHVVAATVLAAGASDHRPVVATLALR